MKPQLEFDLNGSDSTEFPGDWTAYVAGSTWDACEWTGADAAQDPQDAAEVVLDLPVRCYGPGVVFDQCAGRYGRWIADACARM